MIKLYGTLDGAGAVVRHGTGKSGETLVHGEAITESAAGLTKCAIDAKPDGIYIGKSTDGEDYIPVRGDDEFIIDVSGAGALTPGLSAYTLTADGLNLDTTGSTGTHIFIVRALNSAKAVVKFV